MGRGARKRMLPPSSTLWPGAGIMVPRCMHAIVHIVNVTCLFHQQTIRCGIVSMICVFYGKHKRYPAILRTIKEFELFSCADFHSSRGGNNLLVQIYLSCPSTSRTKYFSLYFTLYNRTRRIKSLYPPAIDTKIS